MRDKILSLAAAAALLASVGAANAKGPVELSDVQLDKATAGDAQVTVLLGIATAELNRLVAISDFALGFFSGAPLSSLSIPSLTSLSTPLPASP